MSSTSKKRSFRATTSRRFPKRTLATKAYVKKQIDKDLNFGFKDTIVDVTNLLFTFLPIQLTDIPDGVTDNERDGMTIGLKSVQMRVQVQPNLGAPISAHGRVIIYRWNQSVDPNAGDIINGVGSAAAPVGLPSKLVSKGKYQILYTRMFNVNVNGQENITFKMFRKLRGHTLYSGSGSGSHTKGSVWVQFLSDLSANGPDLHARIRLIYSK